MANNNDNAHKKSDGKRSASSGILNESLCNSWPLEQRNASDLASVDPEPSIKDNTVPTILQLVTILLYTLDTQMYATIIY